MADNTATDVKDAEITLDDFNADEQQPAKAAPSPAPKDDAKAEPKDKAEAKGKEEVAKADDTAVIPDVPTKDEGKEEAKAEDEAVEPEDKPTKADERKTQLNTEIRDLVAQRNALKEEVKKANDEVYQPATEDELVEQGLTATDAKVEALRQQIEMQNYNDKVADAQLTLSSEAERVLRDYPIFNPESDEYKADKGELAKEAAAFVESQLIIDRNTNQVIGSNIDIGKYYETLARASGQSTIKGQLKGQADTEKQLANVDANTSTAPPKEKVDPLLELWRSDD